MKKTRWLWVDLVRAVSCSEWRRRLGGHVADDPAVLRLSDPVYWRRQGLGRQGAWFLGALQTRSGTTVSDCRPWTCHASYCLHVQVRLVSIRSFSSISSSSCCSSGARRRLAYGSADPTDTHCLLLPEIQKSFGLTFLVPAYPVVPDKIHPESRKTVVVVVVVAAVGDHNPAD